MKTTYRGFYTLRWYDAQTHKLKREKTFQNTITQYGQQALAEQGYLSLPTILLYVYDINHSIPPLVMPANNDGFDMPEPPLYKYRRRKKARFHDKDNRGADVTDKLLIGYGIAFEGGGPSEQEWEEHLFSKVILPMSYWFTIGKMEYLDVIYTIEVTPNVSTVTGTFSYNGSGGQYTARRARITNPPAKISPYDVALPSVSGVQFYETQTLGDIEGVPQGTPYNGAPYDVTFTRRLVMCDTDMKIPFNSGNVPSGKIGSVVTSSPHWDIQYQIAFDPPLDKTSENQLRMFFRTNYDIITANT